MSLENVLQKYKSLEKSRRLDFPSKIKIYKKFHLEHSSITSIAREWKISRDTVLGIVQCNQFRKQKYVLPIILKAKHSIPFMPMFWEAPIVHAIYEMEKLLDIWIEDQYLRNQPLTAKLIKAKAEELYTIVQQGNPITRFRADEKWLAWYRHRTNSINLELSSEPDNDFLTQSIQFPSGLKTLIYHEKYSKDQIFNVNRVLLFWKSMPDGTYISKEAEKMANDRLTLLLGCNASGEYKLQPLTIYNSDTLSAKEIRSSNIYQKKQPNATSSLTAEIFEEWLIKDFIPSAKSYCLNKNIPFKILLLLDTTPCFRQSLKDLHPNVRVVFLPRIISRKYQPMEQGIVSIFKAKYLHLTLNMVTQATRGDTDVTVQDFCESYTIEKGVSNITKAWANIPQRCFKTAWKKICPQFKDRFFYTELKEHMLYQAIKNKILSKAISLGFEIDMDDVESLIQSSGSELSYEDLVFMTKCIDHEDKDAITVDLTDEIDSKQSSNVNLFNNDRIESIEDSEIVLFPEALTEGSTERNNDFTHLSECQNLTKFYSTNVRNSEEPDNISEENEFDPLQDVHVVKNEPLADDSFEYQNALCDGDLKVKELKNESELDPDVIAEEIELAFDHITCAMEKFENIDPNNARFQAVRSAVHDMLACYREMFEEKRTVFPP